jgi:hypothetical protein
VIARAKHENFDEALKAPRAVRVLGQVPAFGAIVGYGVAIGPLPGHSAGLCSPLKSDSLAR